MSRRRIGVVVTRTANAAFTIMYPAPGCGGAAAAKEPVAVTEPERSCYARSDIEPDVSTCCNAVNREPSLRPLSPTVGTATPTPSTLGEHRHMPGPTFSPVLLSGSDTDKPSLLVAAPSCRHGSFLAGHNLYSDGIVAVQFTRPCTRPCCAAYTHRTRRRTAPPGAATPS